MTVDELLDGFARLKKTDILFWRDYKTILRYELMEVDRSRCPSVHRVQFSHPQTLSQKPE